MKKVITFRIYATKTLYFKVFVHPTRKSMYKANRNMKPNFVACCRRVDAFVYEGKNKIKRLGLCGYLHFFIKEMGTEIVSHELTHATLNVSRRLGLDPMVESVGNMERKGERRNMDTPDEERVCQIHGRMMRQFVDIGYRKGIYQSD